MPCAEWYTSVDSQRLSTVELKSKAFLAVDSGRPGLASCKHVQGAAPRFRTPVHLHILTTPAHTCRLMPPQQWRDDGGFLNQGRTV
eukprot:8346569-Pyramimonas_sp.AAC.2